MWSVFSSFDSKILLEKQEEIKKKVPPAYKEVNELIKRAAMTANRGKPRSYVFDMVFLGLLRAILIAPIVYLIPMLQWGAEHNESVQTRFGKSRILLVLIYTMMNLVIPVLGSSFQHLEMVAFLVRDGLILPLITSLYLFDRLRIGPIITCFPVIIIMVNYTLVSQIKARCVTENPMQGVRANLVDLLGVHDSILVFVLLSALLVLLGAIDFFFRSTYNILYVAYYAFYAF